MKFIFICVLVLQPILSSSQADFEKQISGSLDSSLHLHAISWDDTHNEFMIFASSLFKKTQSVTGFLSALQEKPEKVYKNKIGPSEYPKLNALSAASPKIMAALQTTLFQFALHDKNYADYCEMSPIAEFYWLLYEYSQSFNGSHGVLGVTQKIKTITNDMTDAVLRDKLAVLLLIRHLVEKGETIYKDPVELERNAIEVVPCNFKPAMDSSATKSASTISLEEVEPCFFGGEKALIRFIQMTIEYPAESREKEEQGFVYVSFTVNEDGTVSDICIEQSSYELLSKEAIRVIQHMPTWLPAKQNGKPVRVRYSFPIRFSLA
ncbi:MAG: energy transducer TonB [Bacteroidetes bacterium]|nr:energy transducer TonB [Bacteroidota bacterium]